MLPVEHIKLLPPLGDAAPHPLYFNIGYDPRFLRIEGLRSLSYPVAPLIAFKEAPSEATFLALHEDLRYYCYHAVWCAHGEANSPPLNYGELEVHRDYSKLLSLRNHEGTHLIDQLIHMLEGRAVPKPPSIERRTLDLFEQVIEKTLPAPTIPSLTTSYYQFSLVPPELRLEGWKAITHTCLVSPFYEWMIEKSTGAPEDPIRMVRLIESLGEKVILPTQRLISYCGLTVIMTNRFHLLPFQESLLTLTLEERMILGTTLKRIILHTGFSPPDFRDALGLLDGTLVIRQGSSQASEEDIPLVLKRAARELPPLTPFLLPRHFFGEAPVIRTEVIPRAPSEDDLIRCRELRVIHVSYEYGKTSMAGLGVAVTGLTKEMGKRVGHQTILCPSFSFAGEEEGVVRIGTFDEITDRQVMYQALTSEGIDRFSQAVQTWLSENQDAYDLVVYHDHHGAKYMIQDKPTVAVIHNHLHWGDTAKKLLHVDAAVCVSPQFALEAQTAGGHGLQPYFQATPHLFGIENGANLISPLEGTREELITEANTWLTSHGYPPLPRDKKFILAVQRYDTYQKWLEALEAVQEVVDARGDSFFICLGISEDPTATEILDRLEGRGNNLVARSRPGETKSTEMQKAIGSTLRHLADLTVILSRTEMGGLVVHEANSCGSPVIATKTGGLMNSVIHGENGLLTEMSFPAIKSAVQTGLDTPWDRAFLKERPKAHTWEHQVLPYLSVLLTAKHHHDLSAAP